MKTVLITGARAPAALEMVRLFSQAGFRVVTCDSVHFALAAGSRASAAYHRHSAPALQPEEFVDQLRDIVRRECVQLLVPTCEEAFYVAEYGRQLRRECSVFLPEHEVMQRAHHKGDFVAYAGSLGLNVPRSQVVTDGTEVASFAALWGTEVVLKPVHSRFASQVQLCPSSAVISGLEISPERPWVVQEYISGRHFSSYSLAREGELTAHAAYSCDERVGQGATVRFQSLPESALAEQIEAWVGSYVRAARWTGQIAFDFIASEGQVFAIECNPRATSGVHLFAQAASFVGAFWGNDGPLVRPSATLVRHLALPRLVLNLKRGKSASWRDFMQAQDVISSWNDPFPGVLQLLAAAEVAWQAGRRGCSLLEATTWDIEYNGAKA